MGYRMLTAPASVRPLQIRIIAILTPAFFLISFLAPTIVFAACFENGQTVVYVNGIFSTLTKAREDLLQLEKKFKKIKQICRKGISNLECCI